MPLIKHVAAKVETPLAAVDPDKILTPLQQIPKAALEEARQQTNSPVYTGRKDASVSKDDYWKRKEDREIAKDPSIRLSGVLQALLGSVNFGQYCQGTTAEEYLAKVEESALRLSKFVAENGK